MAADAFKEYLEGGIAVDEALERALNRRRAFEKHNDGSWEGYIKQRDMRRAADYRGERFASEASQFPCYYICRAGGSEWPCCAVTLSTEWDQLHADPLASKQRCYCPECNAKCKTTCGMLAELRFGPNLSCCSADCPDDDIFDPKCFSIKQRFPDAATSAQILAALQDGIHGHLVAVFACPGASWTLF